MLSQDLSSGLPTIEGLCSLTSPSLCTAMLGICCSARGPGFPSVGRDGSRGGRMGWGQPARCLVSQEELDDLNQVPSSIFPGLALHGPSHPHLKDKKDRIPHWSQYKGPRTPGFTEWPPEGFPQPDLYQQAPPDASVWNPCCGGL